MLEMASGLVPILLKVTVREGLTVPAVCGANTRLEVDRADSMGGRARHVPVNETLCVPPGALLATVTVPAHAPLKGAASIALMVQLAPGARLVGQLLVWAAAPLAAILAMASPAVPVFCNVTACGGLMAPADCAGKLSWLADKNATGADAVPTPANGTVCGLFWLLVAMVTAPLWSPAAVGLNVTVIVQLVPGASVAPQVLVAENGPLAAMPPIFSTALALLKSVTLWGPPAVPVICGPKLSCCGKKDESGPPLVIKYAAVCLPDITTTGF